MGSARGGHLRRLTSVVLSSEERVEKTEQKLRQILLMCRIVVPQRPEFGWHLGHLDYRAREFFAYAVSNCRR